ncbi:cyclic pyranopterin monophosphate synthase MoaC [Tundrisphaera lichenicola]|uniref:cyclic pyranopterin monophosphate synthase MoaC n=1 Tax=Tundrisphaera lichenicola TaxID=2029860 RepID=UPI003EB870EF
MSELTHFDDNGASRMVDVSSKDVTHRMASASGLISMRSATLELILDRKLAKGDVLEVARIAGIMAAKRVGDLIPLCHPIGIDGVTITFVVVDRTTLKIESRVNVHGRTGVEMEALTAVSVAALTIYDMCKAVDREMQIDCLRLDAKSGGRSGDYRRGTGKRDE